MNLHQLGEFGLIEHLRARLPANEADKPGVLQSIGDDAAVLAPLSTPVVTCDALIEGVHFRRDWTTPFLLGRKAMSSNVSDLAASGATPVAAFVALGVSTLLADEDGALAWLDALYDGFQSAADEYGFMLAGGDTVRTSREIMISITVIGEVETQCRGAGAPILRSGARPGDALFVTGTLGDAAAGLFLLEHPKIEVAPQTRAYLLDRHFNPTARTREMRAALLAAEPESSGSTPVTAALDLSDGLAGDAAHIAHRSGLQLEIELAALPISPACREAATAAHKAGFSVSAPSWALSGGEDYELLLCIAPEFSASLSRQIQSDTGTRATQIGICRASAAPNVVLLGEDGNSEIAPGAWKHF